MHISAIGQPSAGAHPASINFAKRASKEAPSTLVATSTEKKRPICRLRGVPCRRDVRLSVS